jgi:hypothetical protein
MKQIFINETPVPSITIHMTERRDPSKICELFPALKYEKPFMLARAVKQDPERYRIVSVGDVKISPTNFSYELRDDGIHLFVAALIAEIGKFSDRDYNDWAAFRHEAALTTGLERKQSKPFYYTGDTIVMINKEELLKEWSMASDQTKAIAMMLLISNRLHGQENEALMHPAAVRTGAKVIDFQMARASQF